MLKTERQYRPATKVVYVSQITLDIPYNEYYTNRYTCLAEEMVEKIGAEENEGDEEHAQILVFSLWKVDTSLCARFMEDEQKSDLFRVFGRMPVELQLRRGSVYTEASACPWELKDLTNKVPLFAHDIRTFWRFMNYLLRFTAESPLHPMKTALLSLCEEAPRCQVWWQEVLRRVEFYPGGG